MNSSISGQQIDFKRLTVKQATIGVLMTCIQIGLVNAVIAYQWKTAIAKADRIMLTK
jgi:hypothetical protein